MPAAGLPEQYGGAAGEHRGEDVEALAERGADRQHGDAGRDGLHVLHQMRQRGRLRYEIGLGEHDHRLRAGLPGQCRRVQRLLATRTGHGQRQEPLDPPEVEFGRERHTDDDVIDVGGQYLALGALGRGRADEGGAAREECLHVARVAAFGVDGDPVPRAHDLHRVTGHDELRVGADGTGRCDDVAQAPVDPDDPTGQQPLPGVRGELGLPARIPAVRHERMRGGRGRTQESGERQGVTLHKGGPGTARTGAGRSEVSRRPRRWT